MERIKVIDQRCYEQLDEARAERDELRRLLAAALDENPTWSSDAAFEAERLVGEVE